MTPSRETLSAARRRPWPMLVLALLAALLLSLAVLQSRAQPQDAREEPAAPAELGTFVPSEKLPADSAVAFPVDI